MDKNYNGIRYTLGHLGYQAVRFGDEEEWVSLAEADDRLGTTDDTRLYEPGPGKQYARLVEVGTQNLLAVARKESANGAVSSPRENSDSQEDRGKVDYEEDDLVDLKSKGSLPNTRTAAYLLAKSYAEGRDDVDHTTLVTSANLAVLKAWTEGLELSNLDAVAFRTVEKEGLALQIKGKNASISVFLVERPYSLKEPWDGRYSISAIAS